jgi:hypothetical protein
MRSKLEKSDAHPEQLEDILKQLLTAVSLSSILHGLKNHRTYLFQLQDISLKLIRDSNLEQTVKGLRKHDKVC